MFRLAKIRNELTILGLIGLLHGFTAAQASDPLIGTWNFRVTVTGGCTSSCKYMGMLAFNQGGTLIEQRGTTVQYESLGYVDRTSLGTWRPTAGTSSYTFRMKNFVFDSTGKLSALVVGTSGVAVTPTRNSFSGTGTAKIFKTSDTLIDTVAFVISGTRF
jgi:hypothetical protein